MTSPEIQFVNRYSVLVNTTVNYHPIVTYVSLSLQASRLRAVPVKRLTYVDTAVCVVVQAAGSMLAPAV